MSLNCHLSDYDASLAACQSSAETAGDLLKTKNAVTRLWSKDATLWKLHDSGHQASIIQRLGWLTSPDQLRNEVGAITAWAQQIRASGYSHAVVLGMGGSSLCPEVCRHTFSRLPGWPELRVLDNTNPLSVKAVEQSVRLENTLFIVSSKSGTTLESNVFYQYFSDALRRRKGERFGENFTAITDDQTPLSELAVKENFCRLFVNPSDIGGRYSAHSYFGWVPAAVMGVDIGRLADRGRAMAARCRPEHPADENPGWLLGVALGALARARRDKLIFIFAPEIKTLGYWSEQLIAESTGKEGKGLVPIIGERLDAEYSQDSDRAFVAIQLGEQLPDPEERCLQAFKRTGHPVIRIRLNDVYDLGGEFFRWEFAVAVAGAVLSINPFDEPNVKESKDNTLKVLETYRLTGGWPVVEPAVSEGPLSLFIDSAAAQGFKNSGAPATVATYLAEHFGRAQTGDYVAILAYLDTNDKNEAALQALRSKVGTGGHLATTLGYGPRYLHSTGQLHKGGAGNALFLQITTDNPMDVAIPGAPFSFGVLKDAQAIGDYQALSRRSGRILRAHITGDVEEGLLYLMEKVGA